MSSDLSKIDVSRRFSENNMFILPEAAELILEHEEPENAIQIVLDELDDEETIEEPKVESVLDSQLSEEDSAEPVDEHKTDISSGNEIDPTEAFNKIKDGEKDIKDVSDVLNRKETLDDRYPEICDTLFNRQLEESMERIEVNAEISVSGDISGKSRGTGEFEDFRKLFNDRYERLVSLFKQRLGTVREVSDIRQRKDDGEVITVVGLVWDIQVTENGYLFIRLEDPSTNELQSVGWSPDSPVKGIFEEVVEDEVIAVRGRLDDGTIWGDDESQRGKPPIMFPDVPRKRSSEDFSRNAKSALIGDVHIGSDEFYPENWNIFVDWIRSSPQLKYLFIAGDIVEGIGVYPDQDEELDIVDIYDQYALAGRMIDQIPDDVQVFMSVGNHDRVRLAEPQPKLPEELQQYFPDNVEFVGNPAMVSMNDTDILMYHGMSINALSEVVPDLDPTDPIPVMEMMLKKRHLAPVYGKNVRLSPEETDYLVIEDIPDVLHCGHVHKYGQDKYNGVHMVNTATWQGQTSFQKSKGIEPEVGYWSVLNLDTGEMKKRTVDDVQL